LYIADVGGQNKTKGKLLIFDLGIAGDNKKQNRDDSANGVFN
jgi:hypothetical protein